MPQFDVYRNPSPATKGRFPLLLDVQSGLLADLQTRVVVPLSRVGAHNESLIEGLSPLVDIQGSRYALVTPQLAGVSSRQLGQLVGNVSESRREIIAALDFLIVGF